MYNQLPSTILKNGTTFDLMVADVYAAWEKHKANPEESGQYKEDQLSELLKSVRG